MITHAKTNRLLLLLLLLGAIPGLFANSSFAQSLTLYTPYPKVAVPPGETVDYSVDLINNGGSIRTADLTVSGLPKGWTYELKSGGYTVEQIAVLPKEKKNMSLQIQVPANVNKGTYRFQVLAKGISSLPLTIEISKQGTFKTEFTTTQANMEGAANSTFTFNATLRNRTAEDQVYSLNAQAPPGWNVAFKANYKQVSSVNIEANKTQDITIEIDPADQAKAGSYKIPLLAATHATSADLGLEVVITGSYALELTTPTGRLSTDITAGSRKRVELVVKNTGSTALKNIDMQASTPINWEVEFEPKKVDALQPGKTEQVFATIKADGKAIAGDYLVTLTAKTPEVTSEASFRTAVKTPLIWGWVGLLLILAALGSVYYLFKKYGRR